MQFLFMALLLITSIFLILLVLVQRGRGGGLTGALGGMGGQSAFGSKAGDLFTRITIGVAAFWILISVAAIKVLNTQETVFGNTDQTSFDDSPLPSLTTDRPATTKSAAGIGDATEGLPPTTPAGSTEATPTPPAESTETTPAPPAEAEKEE